MDGKVLARLVAIIAVAVALTATAAYLAREDRPAATQSAPSSAAETAGDPLRDRLRHCQQMGEAATRDADCLAAWDESRRRFITPGKGF